MIINNGMTNGRVVHIQMDKVNQPIVENIKDEDFMNTAIFGNQYRQILGMLNRYVKYRNTVIERNIDSANNVFTFVGERGSGKTSCMSSVSKLLTSNNIRKLFSYPELKNTTFETIDIIDPSYFDEEHNIVSMVIAKLYKSFNQKENIDSHDECNFDVHHDLIAAFARAQRSMKCLLKDNLPVNELEDDIENLSDLAIAVDLRDDIRNLVSLYMKFIKKENGLLVLSIDDIDLNIDEADRMTEQIRKYLVAPNIIILLAVKLDQLTTIKNLRYSEKYMYLLDSGKLEYDTVEEMTGQYMVKFAPENQRVFMPSAEFYMDSGIEIDGDYINNSCIKQAIPELIFSRTRYLFYNSKYDASCIVPRNLRKMCQLVAMLWVMDIDGFMLENKRIFKNYLFQIWTHDNLNNEDRKLVKRVMEGWKNEQLNRVTLDVLKEKYEKWFDLAQSGKLDNSDISEEIKQIYDVRNREYNLSIGDVMSLIYNLQIAYETYADRCFLFIIQSIYSIALYESYNQITDKMDEMGYDECTMVNPVVKKQILLYDPFSDENVAPYHRLVGGRFFNFRMSPVLPKEALHSSAVSMVSRSDRKIDYVELDKLLTEAVAKWREYKKLSNEGKADNIDLKELQQTVRLAEFFMLCCIRDINLRNYRKGQEDYYDPTFRQKDRAYYNGEFTGKKSLYFDLGAFFYNITTIKTCYRRFKQAGQNLLELCQNDDQTRISLYAEFRNSALSQRAYNNPHAWQSWACIRNMEILFDLYRNLKTVNRVDGANNRLFMAKFFQKLGEYAIETYDRNNQDSNLRINFEYAKFIEKLLNDNDIDDRFSAIFNTAGKDLNNYFIDLNQIKGWNNLLKAQINIDKLLSRRSKDKNKKSTVIDYLMNKEKEVLRDKEFFVQYVFSKYGENMTKDEIREAGLELNRYLLIANGKFKKDTENSVPQSEASGHSEDTTTES